MKDSIESDVCQQIEQLKKCSYQAIDREVAERRIKWFTKNHRGTDKRNWSPPRSAYELMSFDYMNLSEDELPIVLETEARKFENLCKFERDR